MSSIRPTTGRASTALFVLTIVLAGCAGPAVEQVEEARLTPEQIAGEVVAAMDTDTDPCQDFYRYACGTWIDKTELPGDEVRWARSFSVIAKRNREVLRDILESGTESSDPENAKLGRFYEACMDEQAVEQAGVAPMAALMDDAATAVDAGSLLDVAGRFHAVGIPVFFSSFVAGDFKNPDTNITHMFQGGLGLPDRDYYLEEAKREDLAGYRAHVARMFVLLGDSEEEATAHAEQVLQFETELAKVSRRAAEMRDIERLYHKLDRSGLAELTPSLPWARYFAAIGYPDRVQLNIATPEFFERLASLATEVGPQVLQTYLRWHVVNGMAEQLPAAFVEADFEYFDKELNGQAEIRPRWRRCVADTDTALGELLGQAFVDRQFAGDSKQIAQEMIDGIEVAFAAGLPALDWMDDVTRDRAEGKMEAILHKIGYPDKWRDYSSLDITEGDYFGNTIRANNFEFRRQADKAEKPVDRTEWGMSASTVNAYYNPLVNEMVFPAGILQPPFFHRDFPAAMNFGGIGLVMGHELTHGFDDMGSKFDPRGQMELWWEPEAIERFEEKTQCVDDLYSTYEVQPDLFINGKLTLGENIADLGGLKEAFRAYKRNTANETAGAAVPENMTSDQLFFVAFAQTWCQKATPEVERVLVTTDSHSPARFRVTGPVSNLPEFAEVFGCEPGTPMNPVDKCEVW